MIYHAIVFLPILGALIAGFLGRASARGASEIITTSFVGIAAALSWVALVQVGFNGETVRIPVLRWVASGELDVSWALRIDTLTAVMLVVVNTVSFLVHLYSIGYMAEDDSRPRFFAYLSMFTFAMLSLVTSDNFLQLFFGWEGVGLASYLLIGFWYLKPEANAAAIKAFVVNRVGDFGFALGIFGIFAVFGTIGFDAVFRAAPGVAGKPMEFLGYQLDTLTVLCLLLFMGAMGKSAQFLLHTWLPDAMEGPTPVSALIHAATMVTAGVFMVARLSPLFELSPFALQVVTLVGAVTAFFAATVGLVQNDIKRVVAYSTCSQLGYMFVACGVGAYSAGIFHLFTHAFFKALLFLGAGSVIHAMHHEQDMRKMGGLGTEAAHHLDRDADRHAVAHRRRHPASGWLCWLPLQGCHHRGRVCGAHAGQLCLLAAGGRGIHDRVLLVAADIHDLPRTNARRSRDLRARAREPVGNASAAASAGCRGRGRGLCLQEASSSATAYGEFWRAALVEGPNNHIRHAMHELPGWVGWAPFFAMAAGFALSYLYYIVAPSLPAITARIFEPVYLFLLNKWYFDELYDRLFVRPAFWLGRLFWKGGDGAIIDGLGADNIAQRVLWTTGRVVKLQTGYVYHYAFAMLIGVALIITAFMFNDIRALFSGVMR